MKLLGGKHRRTAPAEVHRLKFGLLNAIGKQGGVVWLWLIEFCNDGRDNGIAVLQLRAEMEIAIMAGVPTKRDMDIQA